MAERCPCYGSTLDKFLQPAILTVLSEKSLHGYRILKALARMPMFREQQPDTTGLYRCLKDMERRGLIASTLVAPSKGPAARVFRATPLGLACLMRWSRTLEDHRRALGTLLRSARKALQTSQPSGNLSTLLECGPQPENSGNVEDSERQEQAVDDSDALVLQMGLYKALLPKRLLYSSHHSWFEITNDGTTRCGLTSYAVRLLGDLFRVEWRVKPGEAVTDGQTLGELESAKAVSELYAPLSGALVSINAEVVQDPSLVNADPYKAWLLELSGGAGLRVPPTALQPAAYLEFLAGNWEQTEKLLKGQA